MNFPLFVPDIQFRFPSQNPLYLTLANFAFGTGKRKTPLLLKIGKN